MIIYLIDAYCCHTGNEWHITAVLVTKKDGCRGAKRHQTSQEYDHP